MLSGSFVAIVTPFKDGNVDFDKLDRLVEFHLQNGTNGIVPCGTTGEAPALTEEEKTKVISAVVKRVDGQVPVIAGTGCNNTARTVKSTKQAEDLGCDAALIVTPYYNKPQQSGLQKHYEAVFQGTKIPVVLYNVPGRTGVNLAAETSIRLAQTGRVAAVKEASGDLDQVTKLASAGVNVLSGDDSLTLPMLAVGARGVISVIANILPREMADLVKHGLANEFEQARAIHQKIHPVCKALFVETNPVPVKSAMQILGRLNGELRAPLAPMGDANMEALRKTLTEYGMS